MDVITVEILVTVVTDCCGNMVTFQMVMTVVTVAMMKMVMMEF